LTSRPLTTSSERATRRARDAAVGANHDVNINRSLDLGQHRG
jgi:hypothetical protein